jgi:hypothetical protein
MERLFLHVISPATAERIVEKQGTCRLPRLGIWDVFWSGIVVRRREALLGTLLVPWFLENVQRRN